MVSQHPDHLAGRRCGHRPQHRLHLTGAEHRTPLLPGGAVQDVPHQHQSFTGVDLKLLEKAPGLSVGPPGECASEVGPDEVLNGLEIAAVRGGERHHHGVNNQGSDSPYS